jgi:hypothetical protein
VSNLTVSTTTIALDGDSAVIDRDRLTRDYQLLVPSRKAARREPEWSRRRPAANAPA